MNKRGIGNIGEDRVAEMLAGQGFRIVARNYTIRGGEIDIIAENDDFLVFVEVKSRKPNSMVSGFEAVNDRKKGLLIRAAADFCAKNPTQLQPRFDVAQVIIDRGRVLHIDYIENAFDTTGYNYIF